ncbi:MAG: metal-sulfur cluster assembly factor [Propionibacteriaceae bacterium]|jgi:metal-sulfur cluster biosynthetic enzyme|nr:metal-sulfur cluster assembly factor [Propionibacteriaceae bacterium]
MSEEPQDMPLGADPSIVLRSVEEREAAVMERLKEVVDPELGVNVVDLGLVYGVSVGDDFDVTLDMTLTTPACPLTDQIEWGAQTALVDIARSVTINWVWLPPWTMDRITEEGREQLRYIGYNV